MVKISELPIELSPTSNDIVAMVDVETSGTKKVSFDEFGKAINYTNSISADANNLLAVDGSNKLNLTAANELISSDPNNTISIGTDNKLFRSQAGAALPENNFYVGDSLSQPVAKTANEVKKIIGLPTDYKSVNIVRDSGTQVTVSGSVRSVQDDMDLELSSETPVALLTPSENVRYNLFFAKVNSTSPTVAFFDSASVPSGYAHYRIIATIPTDSISNLSDFSNDGNEVELWSGSATTGSITLNESISNYKFLNFIGGNAAGFGEIGSYFITANEFLNRVNPLQSARITVSTAATTRIIGFATGTTDNIVDIVQSSGASLYKIVGVK